MTHLIIMDAIAHVLALDVAWLFNLVFSNLFWVFVFATAAHFFFGQKGMLKGFFILVVYVWAFVDISSMTGWVFGGLVFIIYFTGGIFLESWGEKEKWISSRASPLATIWFLLVWLGSYFFFG